jgi:hypothetical protein
MAQYQLTGAGVIGLSSNVQRLFVTVTSFAAGYSTGTAIPTNYYRLGQLRLGVQGGYYPTIPLDGADMVVDVPPGVTSLGYGLDNVTSITVTEVFNVYAPFPAGGVHVPGLAGVVNLPNDSTSHDLCDYTVPSGRSALLEYAKMAAGLSTTADSATMVCLIDDMYVIYESIYGALNLQTEGTIYNTESLGNPLHLFAGESVHMSALITGTATPVSVFFNLRIIEYPQAMW